MQARPGCDPHAEHQTKDWNKIQRKAAPSKDKAMLGPKHEGYDQPVFH
jgi:hypothetical protein